MKRSYFDYAATTPLDPRVRRAMAPYFESRFGNPGSLHRFGQEAIAALDEARASMAQLLDTDFRQVIFTGSATEANNLALRGTVANFRQRHPRVVPRLIVSAIEHESVLETAHELAREGIVELVVLPVDVQGIVRLADLRRELTSRTALVSIMFVNNEIGTVQPIAELAEIIQQFKKTRLTKSAIRNSQLSNYPLFHVDAAQAFSYFDCTPDELGADLLTISAHKMSGPKGVGVLYVRESKQLQPIITGGGQEFGLRSGTENVPLIVGCAVAARLASEARAQETVRLTGLRRYFFEKLRTVVPRTEIHGPGLAAQAASAPHILSVYLPGQSAIDRLTALDLMGFAVSAGSACRARSATPSPVIRALGFSVAHARQTVRLSFGRSTTKADIERLVKIIGQQVSA